MLNSDINLQHMVWQGDIYIRAMKSLTADTIGY